MTAQALSELETIIQAALDSPDGWGIQGRNLAWRQGVVLRLDRADLDILSAALRAWRAATHVIHDEDGRTTLVRRSSPADQDPV